MKVKNVLLWVIAVIITLGMVVYQRATGPTYPVRGEVSIDGQQVHFKLLRSFMGYKDARISIDVKDETGITGRIEYRRFKSHDAWSSETMQPEKGELAGYLPKQPAAGKIMYNVVLFKDGVSYPLNESPVILRYTGEVPPYILAPHIFFMFISLLFGIRAGIEVLFRRKDTAFLSGVVVITLFLGGLVLGPIVQKYAFDAYWTGWPFGHDLTDNKTIFSFILWLVAWWVLRKNKENKVWPMVAVIGMLLVYLIPHSVLGSEIDFREDGQKTEQLQK